MRRVRYTAEGGHYRTNGIGFDPGDERDVDDDLAAYLCSRDDFEAVDGGAGPTDATPHEADEPPDETANGTDDTDSTFDVGSFLDRNVDPIAEDILAGEADAHLDELSAEASRVTVTDAIGERRAELETEG